MERIDITKHLRDPKYYNRDRDIETALAWNGVKKTLTEAGREELFDSIKSVKVTEKNIIIRTEKPLVNTELKLYKEKFRESLSIPPLRSKQQKRDIRFI